MDGRLFKDELLYCEGKHKPWFRGKIHLASLVFLPVAVYYISFSNSPWVYFNLFGNVLCFGVSGLYHTFDWSPSTELFLQKLDHRKGNYVPRRHFVAPSSVAPAVLSPWTPPSRAQT